MTGSALFDFLISIVALGGAVFLFMAVIDGISPNPLFTRIAKIAVGVAALIAFLFSIKGVFFGGGGGALAISAVGIIYFAIGILVMLVVLYLVKMVIGWFGLPPEIAEPVLFVIGAIALIALLGLAATTLFGGAPLLTGNRPFLR
jgi:hypothetical protein